MMKFFNEHPQITKFLILFIMASLVSTFKYYSDPDRTRQVVDRTIEDSGKYVDAKGNVHDSPLEEAQAYRDSDAYVFTEENYGKHFRLITQLVPAGKEGGVYWYYGDDGYNTVLHFDQAYVDSKYRSGNPDYCFYSEEELTGIGYDTLQEIDGILCGFRHFKASENNLYTSSDIPVFKVYNVRYGSFEKLAVKSLYEDRPHIKTKDKGVEIELESVDFNKYFTKVKLCIRNQSGQYIKVKQIDVFSDGGYLGWNKEDQMTYEPFITGNKRNYYLADPWCMVDPDVRNTFCYLVRACDWKKGLEIKMKVQTCDGYFHDGEILWEDMCTLNLNYSTGSEG